MWCVWSISPQEFIDDLFFCYLISEKMNTNPWKVDSIQEFYFLKCPECPFTHKEENYFQNHAINNHPLSVAFFSEQTLEPISNFDECNKVDTDLNAVVKEELIETENDVELDSVDGFRTLENDQICRSINISNEEFYQSISNKPGKFENVQNTPNTPIPIRHITSVREGVKQLKCQICYSVFTNRSHINRHIASVHEGKKPFKCSICDYSFSSKHNMNTHIASVHEGKKPFKCSVCYSSFSLKSVLKRHIASVHEGKKPFKCSKCDSNFSARQDMNRHISSVHEGKKRNH